MSNVLQTACRAVSAGNSKIPIPKIRYRPFGIGIGTDIAFGVSVPESTAGSTEIPKYRISFGIPSSGGGTSETLMSLCGK